MTLFYQNVIFCICIFRVYINIDMTINCFLLKV